MEPKVAKIARKTRRFADSVKNSAVRIAASKGLLRTPLLKQKSRDDSLKLRLDVRNGQNDLHRVFDECVVNLRNLAAARSAMAHDPEPGCSPKHGKPEKTPRKGA